MIFADVYYPRDTISVPSFFRLPRQFSYVPELYKLSSDAKLIYAIMLDRLCISFENGWFDETGRVYIYYTLDEVQRELNCRRQKAQHVLTELEKSGLIERHTQGQGKPSRTYVRQIVDVENSVENALERLRSLALPV